MLGGGKEAKVSKKTGRAPASPGQQFGPYPPNDAVRAGLLSLVPPGDERSVKPQTLR